MRTTVSLDDEVLSAAKRRAAELGVTLGAYVESAVRRDMARPVGGDAPAVPVFSGEGGPVPGVDLTTNYGLQSVLDGSHDLTTLR